MNVELIYLAMLTLSGFLFALGGTGGWTFASKAWRRFGIPVALGALLISIGYSDWRTLGYLAGLTGALHLGYGDTKPWAYKFAVGASYAIPCLFLGWTWWLIGMPVVFLGLFALSNWKATEKDMVWKVAEFLIGSFIAVTLIGALQRPW